MWELTCQRREVGPVEEEEELRQKEKQRWRRKARLVSREGVVWVGLVTLVGGGWLASGNGRRKAEDEGQQEGRRNLGT